LKIEVQPAQTNAVERVKRFVNIHPFALDKQISTLPPSGKISAYVHERSDFDLILGP